MATPQDLTTTVNGRRCTRSRARTAATSTLISTEVVDSSTESTPPSTTQEAAQIQTTTTEAPPLPPPPSSTSTTEAAQEAPPPETTSSTIGTSDTASSLTPSSTLANLVPSALVAAAPGLPSEIDTTQAVVTAADVSVAAESPTAPSATSDTTSSNAISIAVTSDSSLSTSTLPLSTSTPSPTTVLPDEPASSATDAVSVPIGQPEQSQNQPEQSQPTETGAPSGGEAGVISPDQGADQGIGEGNGLTLSNDGQTNVAGIAGGVVGGFIAIILISALLFLCLRRRKTGTFEKWQRKMSEKSRENDGFLPKVRAIPGKLKAIPAGVSNFLARIRGEKAGPSSNPYRRHTVRNSVSSVYSTGSRRSRSINEPSGKFLQQLRGFSDRMPSLKRSKTLLQKKQDSFVVGSRSPFPGIMDDPVKRTGNEADNRFVDPLKPPSKLQLMNPGSPTPVLTGMQQQQRGPLTPKPVAMAERSSDPFASIMDELEKRNGSGTPEWLRDNAQRHKRTASAQTALRSHPPSTYTASVYTTVENPFFDPSDAPPVPKQQLPPNPPPRAANSYGALPPFNATSSTLSRISTGTDMFGSRMRQSDPFDLDRPEVLSFGAINGRGVRASVTRQNSRARRSNVPSWVNLSDGNFERGSAVPGPLRKLSAKR